ncbi:MAG: hypothetical protein CMF61_05720 [Magnetococcales bacterium]|nr:hypothetical protein [Magnetococcales bacterium]|tara:strand:- start:544 stop:915 length:372 start_codon:yes stop_codon:yes gene_type:complete
MDRIDEITIELQTKLENAHESLEKCKRGMVHLRSQFTKPVESYDEQVQSYITQVDKVLNLLPSFSAGVKSLQEFFENEDFDDVDELEKAAHTVRTDILPTVEKIELLSQAIFTNLGMNLDDFA